MGNVETIRVRTASDLEARLQALSDERAPGGNGDIWIFRGQENADWPLTTTLERKIEFKPLHLSESQMVYHFRTQAHLFSAQPLWNFSEADWIALMQHHGAPTRLLDWTYSPFVALFFALDGNGASDQSSVWAVNQNQIRYWFLDAFRTAFPEFEASREINSADDVIFQKLKDPTKSPRGNGLVSSVLPRYHNARLASQQGLFLMNCCLNLPFEKSLLNTLNRAEGRPVRKFVFPRRLKNEILRRLTARNIHAAALFPDLDGLARFVGSNRVIYSADSMPHK